LFCLKEAALSAVIESKAALVIFIC